MISSKLLSAASVIALLAIVAVIGRLSPDASAAVRSAVKPAIRRGGKTLGLGQTILMANIPKKSDAAERPETNKTGAKPPGLSDLRITYKLPRTQIHESNIGVTQPIDDHWCKDFKLTSVPFGCSCWRYEYLAYFCVDWSCVNGHASDFAMCQFLNVSWPIDPPRRRSSNDIASLGGIQNILKKLADYLPVKGKRDATLVMKLMSLSKELAGKGEKQ